MARLAAAEQNFYLGQLADARTFALRARDLLKKDTPEWRRATDIILASKPTRRRAQGHGASGLRRLAVVAVGVVAAMALGACRPAATDEAAFGEKVRAYLLAHPEVIQEAEQQLQVKMEADAVAAQRKAQADLPRLRAAIERDPRDFVANPGRQGHRHRVLRLSLPALRQRRAQGDRPDQGQPRRALRVQGDADLRADLRTRRPRRPGGEEGRRRLSGRLSGLHGHPPARRRGHRPDRPGGRRPCRRPRRKRRRRPPARRHRRPVRQARPGRHARPSSSAARSSTARTWTRWTPPSPRLGGRRREGYVTGKPTHPLLESNPGRGGFIPTRAGRPGGREEGGGRKNGGGWARGTPAPPGAPGPPRKGAQRRPAAGGGGGEGSPPLTPPATDEGRKYSCRSG